MLKITNIQIRLMIDINMYLIIEKGMRGGTCEPIYYFGEANNCFVNSNFKKPRDKELCVIS